MATLLIVGGGGFIGSHTCLRLIESNHNLIVLDNFSNSSPIALERVINLAKISTNKQNQIIIRKGDVRDSNLLEGLFNEKNNKIDAVINFAGLKSVEESIKKPDLYWDINVRGTENLLKVMEKNKCKVFVFSSSATIYGNPDKVPIPEEEPIKPLNPYGTTKAHVEKILAELAGCNYQGGVLAESPNGWRIATLRYFNPVGAHHSGEIGESPTGIPNNLFPLISQVAIGKRKSLKIYGNNWPTADGTGVRDYIHVMDLAEGHCAALEHLLVSKPQLLTLNLGTGIGTSVMQVLKAFEKTINKKIPYEIIDERSGDSAIAVANVAMAKKYINWESKRNLHDMCKDAWNWQITHPNGYL